MRVETNNGRDSFFFLSLKIFPHALHKRQKMLMKSLAYAAVSKLKINFLLYIIQCKYFNVKLVETKYNVKNTTHILAHQP